MEVLGAPQKRGATLQSQKSHARAPDACRGGFAGRGVLPAGFSYGVRPTQNNKTRHFYRFPKFM